VLFTDERYFEFTFEYLPSVQAHSSPIIHHYKPDSIYLDGSLHLIPGAATAVSSFAAGHCDEEAAVSDVMSPGLPAGRGRGSGMAFAGADV
jgi:hypothetical protein